MAEPSFEKDLEHLEKIVEALEAGELSLDESLKQFELGTKLAARCEKALSAAEKKIEILARSASGEIEAAPFGDDGEDSPAVKPAPKGRENSGASEASGEEDDEDAEEGELLF